MSEQVKVSPEAAPSEATASSILAFRNRPPVEHHDMPDGRRVYIHGLSDYEVHHWLAECGRKKEEDGGERIDDPTADAKLLIRSVRDGKGKPLFTEADITRLIELPNFVKAPLIRKAMKVSAIGGAADAEILKNYAATLAAGS